MNYESNNIKKVLSIYPNKKGFSYSFFENKNLLIRVGSHVDGKDGFSSQIHELIEKFEPHLIVTEDQEHKSCKRSKKVVSKLKEISAIAKKHNLPIRLYTRLMVQGVFSCFEVNNKYEMAKYLSGKFPQLKHRMPPKPQIWEKEHYRMRWFDSIAFAFAYYYIEGDLNSK